MLIFCDNTNGQYCQNINIEVFCQRYLTVFPSSNIHLKYQYVYVCMDVCLDVCTDGWMDGWITIQPKNIPKLS